MNRYNQIEQNIEMFLDDYKQKYKQSGKFK